MGPINGIEDVKKMFSGDHSSQNKIQISVPGMGDTVIAPTRNVGDKWLDEDGNEWEQKDGYSLKLGKSWQQELHHDAKTFLNCPKDVCTCYFPSRLDKKMKAVKDLCFDCVVKMEHLIRLNGEWDEYERGNLRENGLAWLREAEADKQAIADELSRTEFVDTFGGLEKWDSTTTKESLLTKIEDEFTAFREEFINKLDKVAPPGDDTNGQTEPNI